MAANAAWLIAELDRAKLPELRMLAEMCPADTAPMRTRAQHIEWLNRQRELYWDRLHLDRANAPPCDTQKPGPGLCADEVNAFLRSLPAAGA